MLILLIIWSIYPTFTGNSFGYSSMVWFIVLYLIGSFIKLHVNVDKINYNRLFLIFLISTLIIYAGSSIIGYLSILFDVGNLVNSENTFTNLYTFFASERNLFVLITSVSLFLLFLKRKEFSNKYINYIAGSVLGVYLIHDNVFIRPFLWKSLFNVSSYYYSSNLILIELFSIVTIFVICIGIDIIRRETIEKIWIWILDNKLNMFSNWTIDKFRLFGNLIKNYLKN